MAHRSITRELQDQVALHSLGLLDEEQAAALENHITGCKLCKGEFRSFKEAAMEFAIASSAEPPESLRSRVLEAFQNQPIEQFAVIRGNEDKWVQTPFPGVTMKALYEDPGSRNVTQLIRLSPGAHYPPHHHFADEQCYVIEGDLKIGDDVFEAGDFTFAASGTVHGAVSSYRGCLLLIVASPHNEVLASA